MRISKITVGKALTINLGDWNSLKPHVEYEATLNEGDDPEEVRRELCRLVDKHLDEILQQHTDGEDDNP